MSEVVELNELQWSFEGQNPYLNGSWNRIPVDPCPGYSHDYMLVKKEYDRLLSTVPISTPPIVFLLSYESISRTNGWAEEYGNEIVLSGKRIPIHPAMTKYLVAHEYGHHIEYRLKDIRSDDNLLEKYQNIRGGTLEYRPGLWHQSTRELFANDFRILVAGREEKFWPHPDYPHPHKLSKIADFWADAVEDLEIEAAQV